MPPGSFYEFNPNPKHFFECTVPPPPEEIKVYPHPVYPIEMYSNGIFFLDKEHDHLLLTPRKFEGYSVSKGQGNKMPMEEFYGLFGRLPTKSESKNRQFSFRLKASESMAYECYHNVSLPKHYHIHFYNHNPYDLRKENLWCTYDTPQGYEYRKDWLKSQQEFNRRTIEELDNRVRQAEQRGIDPKQYIKLLGVPRKYYNLWEKKTQQD